MESCAGVLTYGWLSPQRAVPQDTGFSSLFLKVLMQILQWLDSPAVEDGPLQAQLKLFATRYSARHRISDGEHSEWAGTGGGDCGGAKPSESRVGLLKNSTWAERQAVSVWAHQSHGVDQMVHTTACSAQWAPAPG